MTKQEIRRTVRALRRSEDPELLREYSEACAARRDYSAKMEGECPLRVKKNAEKEGSAE